MATATEPRSRVLEPEQRIVLYGVGWEGYEAVLRLVGDGHVRLTYDRGDLELMSPSWHHEVFGNLLGRVVETVTEELRIPCRGLGSTTWKKQRTDCGLEPDECYYLASFPWIRGKRKTIDLNIDPPPDLAIDVEIGRGALDRRGIYAALGVPEVWRWDGETLQIAQLQADGTDDPIPVGRVQHADLRPEQQDGVLHTPYRDRLYAEVAASPGLLFLSADEITRWLLLAEELEDHSEWNRRFRAWVRETLVPNAE